MNPRIESLTNTQLVAVKGGIVEWLALAAGIVAGWKLMKELSK